MSEESIFSFKDFESALGEGQIGATSEPTGTEEKDNKDNKQDNLEDLTSLIGLDNATGEDGDSAEGGDSSGEGSSDSEDTISSPISTFASALHQKGFLSSFDQEEFKKLVEETGDEQEALLIMADEEFENRVAAVFDSYTKEQKEFLVALGKGISEDLFKETLKADLELNRIKDEDLEDVEVQKQLYTRYLKETTKFSDAKIASLVKEKEDLDKLKDEALEALPELKTLNKSKLEQAAKEAEERAKADEEKNKQTIQTFKERIAATKELIPGVAITKQMQEAILKNLTTPVKLPNGQMVNPAIAKKHEDPIKFEINLQYLALLTDGFTDLSKIGNPVKTATTTKLKDALDRNNMFTANTSRSKASSKETEDLMNDFKSLMKKGKI